MGLWAGWVSRRRCRKSLRGCVTFAGLDLFSVRLPDFVRTTTFRCAASAFAVCIVLFSAFVYWEAADYMLAEADAAITAESLAIAADSPSLGRYAISDRLVP